MDCGPVSWKSPLNSVMVPTSYSRFIVSTIDLEQTGNAKGQIGTVCDNPPARQYLLLTVSLFLFSRIEGSKAVQLTNNERLERSSTSITWAVFSMCVLNLDRQAHAVTTSNGHDDMSSPRWRIESQLASLRQAPELAV